MIQYLITIGLETHVQLKTATKMFCGCSLAFGEEPNTTVCPVCMGYPGALPVMNREAVRLTVLSGLMLGARSAATAPLTGKTIFIRTCRKTIRSRRTRIRSAWAAG